MALIIKSTEIKDIMIKNTNICILDIYARIQFTAHPNGKSIEACLTYFENKDKYLENIHYPVDLPSNYDFDIELEQSTINVHNQLKAILEEEGFEVEIQL